jgi:hypothetical protein
LGYNYYKILGLKNNAGKQEIKNAYRKLAFKYHPDRNFEVKAKEFFQLLNEAYSTLSDDEKRVVYDIKMNFQPQASAINSKDRVAKNRRAENTRSYKQPVQPLNDEYFMPPKFARYILFSTGLIFGLFMLIFPIIMVAIDSLSPVIVFTFLGFVLTVDSLAGLTGYRTMLFYELFRTIKNWFKVDFQGK